MAALRIFLVALAVFSLDQATKHWALRFLSQIPSFPVLPGIFHLTLVRNPGVAFGLLSGLSLPVALGTTLILLGLLAATIRRGGPQALLGSVSLGLILGGAFGNLLDRIRWGGVIDFIDFRIWPVFNVADGCITIGAILMAWDLLRHGRPKGSDPSRPKGSDPSGTLSKTGPKGGLTLKEPDPL